MRDRKPGRTKFRKLTNLFLGFTITVIIGCAGEPIGVEFPINHPANPGAHATEFIPPQNPFQTDVAGIEKEPETDSMMKHKMNQENDRQHPGHNMGTAEEDPSDLKTTTKPAPGENQSQHKEHSQ